MKRLTKQSLLQKAPSIIINILSFAIPVLLAAIILNFVIMISVVASESMEPTLKVDNIVIYNRLSYKINEPSRGDVVAFFSDEFNAYYGKRIIGIPGDEVSFQNGHVVINGQYYDESEYIVENMETYSTKTFTVPANSYFLLGDNREISFDSRYWENPYIPKEKIIGKYMLQIGNLF